MEYPIAFALHTNNNEISAFTITFVACADEPSRCNLHTIGSGSVIFLFLIHAVPKMLDTERYFDTNT
eukprot:scaffold295926_cov19-Prasinocladus_malaysianus.AAC.1